MLAAFFYDLVLLFGLLLLATTLAVIPSQAIFGIENIGSNLAFRLFLVLVIIFFYLWFWTHGGQTLGMRAWRIKLVDDEGGSVNYAKAGYRLLIGTLFFGIAPLWILFNRERMTLHDKLARTRLILLPKK